MQRGHCIGFGSWQRNTGVCGSSSQSHRQLGLPTASVCSSLLPADRQLLPVRPAGLHPPAQHIAECWNSAEFFANKLLKDFRGVDDRQVAWAKGLKVGRPAKAVSTAGWAGMRVRGQGT